MRKLKRAVLSSSPVIGGAAGVLTRSWLVYGLALAAQVTGQPLQR
jgi:hypothetical protein